MTIIQFGLMVLGIWLLTEVVGKFFAKKVEKQVLSLGFGVVWTLTGCLTAYFAWSAEVAVEALLAIVVSGVAVDKIINPILASKKKTE